MKACLKLNLEKCSCTFYGRATVFRLQCHKGRVTFLARDKTSRTVFRKSVLVDDLLNVILFLEEKTGL